MPTGRLGIVVRRAGGTEERFETEPEKSTPAEQEAKGETSVEWRWFFQGFPDDVVTARTRYLERLAALVQECEAGFGGP